MSVSRPSLLPLGALAAGVGLSLLSPTAMAQADAAPPAVEAALPNVTVKAKADKTPEAKQSYQATTTSVGKGKQAIRDIPQSITVVTEKLMDDRNLDDFREVLRTTAGISFQAGETGEEDVRLRGFSLLQAGDIYVDGSRDVSIVERDTFNNDRVEVLKGSASMLFGKGSTGGVVNQVNKQPFLMTQHSAELTLGSGKEKRLTGDFNLKTGDSEALRVNVLVHDEDNYGAKIEKHGIAPSYRWGIGTADEFLVGLYHLAYDNLPNYNHPAGFIVRDGFIQEAPSAKKYYGLDSDYNQGSSTYGTLSHIHRFGDGGELKSTFRHGHYERELLATRVRWAGGNPTSAESVGPNQGIGRTENKGRVGYSDITVIQSDYTNKFQTGEIRHNLIAGVDIHYESALRNQSAAQTRNTTSGSPYYVPNTTVGGAGIGGSVPDSRTYIKLNQFQARTLGFYAQDTVELNSVFKLIGGLRHDNFQAKYQGYDGSNLSRTEQLWSPRVGALYQPSDVSSFHLSYGTSYNTSGDTYQYELPQQGVPVNAKTARTAPEKSRNFEVGGKFDLFGGNLSIGSALFYSEKYNERNTDADSAATQQLLSGKRHAVGVDIDIAGRINPNWDVFVSYTGIPEAKIDKSNVPAVTCNANTGVCAPNNAQQEGDRPALTPKHSASFWTTYRLTPNWRVGGGLNYRSAQHPDGARLVQAQDFTTADLMAEYTVNTNYSLRLNVTNVTDELYADSLYRGHYVPGAPRTVQLTLKATF